MRLSAPIYRLKRHARSMSRERRIPLNEALDLIAREEGFSSWSLLAARASATTPARQLFASLSPGDLLLLGARPGHGKTAMALELLAEAMKCGGHGVFFTLEYSAGDVAAVIQNAGCDLSLFGERFAFEDSDEISADYIVDRLRSAPRGTLAVVDYLQLLDQRRDNPELAVQIGRLKRFAREAGTILVFISQIDRSYDATAKPCPDLEDVRLPNPLDLALFNKTCFLNDGEVRIEAAG